MTSLFSCCMRADDREEDDSHPSETTHLLNGGHSSGGAMTPIIDHQPSAHPEMTEEDEDELDGIFGDMIQTMVRVKQPNPFLTGTVHTPSTSRNPSPRSQVPSSRGGQRSSSRGRVATAYQVRRVKPPRPGAEQAPVREESETRESSPSIPAASLSLADDSSSMGPDNSRPIRSTTQASEELERQKYVVRLKTEDIVQPWKAKMSDDAD